MKVFLSNLKEALKLFLWMFLFWATSMIFIVIPFFYIGSKSIYHALVLLAFSIFILIFCLTWIKNDRKI